MRRVSQIKIDYWSQHYKAVFLPVQNKEPKISIESKSSSKDGETDLPEARWLAEVLSHLVRSLR